MKKLCSWPDKKTTSYLVNIKILIFASLEKTAAWKIFHSYLGLDSQISAVTLFKKKGPLCVSECEKPIHEASDEAIIVYS